MNIKLKPFAAGRVQQGYPLVKVKDLSHFKPLPPAGTWVRVQDEAGNFLGHAFAEGGGGDTAFRMVSKDRRPDLDRAWFEEKVDACLASRRSLLAEAEGACRLINGENDGLPGIFCDRFGPYAVMDVLSAGAMAFVPWVEAALAAKLKLKGLLRKERFASQGGPRVSGKDQVGLVEAFGEVPAGRFAIREGGMRLWVDLRAGAHEGLFLDQRANRALVAGQARGREVLNCFCYTGSFSVACLLGGAARAVQVDISGPALDWARDNMQLNGLDPAAQEWHQAEVFEILGAWKKKDRKFGLVIQDPPPFSRSKHGVFQARRDYARLAADSLALVSEGGLLAAACGVQDLGRPSFFNFLRQAAVEAGVVCSLVSPGLRPPDFPVLEGYPEGDYQKFALIRVEKRGTRGELTGVEPYVSIKPRAAQQRPQRSPKPTAFKRIHGRR